MSMEAEYYSETIRPNRHDRAVTTVRKYATIKMIPSRITKCTHSAKLMDCVNPLALEMDI